MTWAAKDTQRIKELWFGGVKIGVMAREFNKSKEAVYSKIKRLGLPPRKTFAKLR